MARYIDADELSENIIKRVNNPSIRGWLLSLINEAPTADMQEVVRCKDCKYLMFSDFYGECSWAHQGIVQPDDYCSHGERKINNEQ